MKKQKRGVHNNYSLLSTKWIIAQFGEDKNKPVIAYKSNKSVNCVQHALTNEDHMPNSDWVSLAVQPFLAPVH